MSSKRFSLTAACLAVVAVSFLLTATPATGATWIGGTGGDWHTASNWDTGVPGSGDNAQIANSGSAIIDADVAVKNISVGYDTNNLPSEPFDVLTINSGTVTANNFDWSSLGRKTGKPASGTHAAIV